MEVTQNHHKTFIERFRPVGTCHEPESASRFFFLHGAHTEHTCVCAPRQKANGEALSGSWQVPTGVRVPLRGVKVLVSTPFRTSLCCDQGIYFLT